MPGPVVIKPHTFFRAKDVRIECVKSTNEDFPVPNRCSLMKRKVLGMRKSLIIDREYFDYHTIEIGEATLCIVRPRRTSEVNFQQILGLSLNRLIIASNERAFPARLRFVAYGRQRCSPKDRDGSTDDRAQKCKRINRLYSPPDRYSAGRSDTTGRKSKKYPFQHSCL